MKHVEIFIDLGIFLEIYKYNLSMLKKIVKLYYHIILGATSNSRVGIIWHTG